MEDFGYQDFAAYKVIQEILGHSWGIDDGVTEEELSNIMKLFELSGGSWEKLMDGDISQISILEQAMISFVSPDEDE